jgi:tetratricopeptide (TPR) repeat protein
MKIFGCVILLCLFVCGRAQDTGALLQAADSLSDGQPELAVEILNRALAADPDSEEVLKVRAEAYGNLKQYGKAAADYKKLARLSPDEESNWFLSGYNLYQSGQYRDALTSLNRATKINPQYLPAFHFKIRALLALNENEAALKVSDSTLMIGETAMNYFLQGEVNKRMNARQKAEWAYAKATKTDNGFVEAYLALAGLAADTNKAEETLVNADAVLAIDPDSEAALIARSRGFALLKQYGEAIDDVSSAIRLNPSNLSACYWRGTYYLENNAPQEALKDFDFVLQKDTGNWQALAGRADAYAATGDKESALAGYRKLLAAASDYPEKDEIIQRANRRIFELGRENHAPQLTLTDPPVENFELHIPDNRKTITIKGRITDESPVGPLLVNGQKIPVVAVDGGFEFAAIVNVIDIQQINMEVSDIYGNLDKPLYHLIRDETGKPQVVLFTPKASDNGMIILEAGNEASLYIEGKVTDESTIISIFVDGRAVDFDQDVVDPAFSAVIDVGNKTHFTIAVSDRYGNTTEQTYVLEKVTVSKTGTVGSSVPGQLPAIEAASQ